MLRQRIITALVLVLILLVALTADSLWPFALLVLVLIAAAGWEWGRLNQAGPALSVGMGLAVAAAGGVALGGGWRDHAPGFVWWVAATLWVGMGAVALRTGPLAWPQLPRAARWAVGLAALWFTWLAVAHARAVGINFMLSVFCLVWMADVAAYFGGKTWGRRKLAPSISPGKSWEGVWSGMVGVLLLSALWMWIDGAFKVDGPSVYSRFWVAFGPLGMVAALIALSGLSVVGDLVESLVKRAAGAKDSSRLLPGHGGVLDRVDALMPVVPAAMALMTLAGAT
jgi:phosphatidate cytidylyltransferase